MPAARAGADLTAGLRCGDAWEVRNRPAGYERWSSSFFLVVWVSLVAILVAAPGVYDQALRLPRDATVGGDRLSDRAVCLHRAALDRHAAAMALDVLADPGV